MIKIVTASFCLLLLVACGSIQTKAQQNSSQASDCEQSLSNEHSMQMDIATNLMEEGKLHAALAHLDNIKSTSLKAKYLRAEILRQIDERQQAKLLYLKLIDTCMAGSGQHGLGLIAAQEDELSSAISHLKLATDALPIDPRVRNDYGYALLLDGQLKQARHQFLTALELGDETHHAESNLILLLLVSGQQTKAEQLAESFGIKANQYRVLAEQSASLKASIHQQ